MSFLGGIVDSFKGAVKNVIGKVRDVKSKLMRATGLDTFMQKIGPVGTIALMLAIPYAASYFASTAGAVGAAASGSSSAALTGATASAAGEASLTSGVAAATESMSQAAMLAEQTAAFGAEGASLTAEALGTSSQAAMLAEQTAEFGQAGAESTYQAATTSSPIEPAGFDFGNAAKSTAKALLSGSGQGRSIAPPTTDIPPLSPTQTVKGVTSASGGGLGYSKYTEEYQPGLTSKAREQEQIYKSLLAKGY